MRHRRRTPNSAVTDPIVWSCLLLFLCTLAIMNHSEHSGQPINGGSRYAAALLPIAKSQEVKSSIPFGFHLVTSHCETNAGDMLGFGTCDITEL